MTNNQSSNKIQYSITKYSRSKVGYLNLIIDNYLVIVIWLLVISFAVVTDVSHAAGKKEEKSESAKAKEQLKEMTVEEILQHIKDTLEHQEEVLNVVPELKRIRDTEGRVSYEFKGVKIEKLDRDTLMSISNRVTSESTKMHMERLQKQLETIRHAQHASQQAVRTGTPPSMPPRIPPAPPSVPRGYVQPPPQPPPAAPRLPEQRR